MGVIPPGWGEGGGRTSWIHQMSEEVEAGVSKEARERAEEMAREGLAQKLKDLDMGEVDWTRCEDLRKRVDLSIRQLRVLLKDIKRRKEKRVWL